MFDRCLKENQMVDMYIQGDSAQDIADKFDVSLDEVLDVLKEAELI